MSSIDWHDIRTNNTNHEWRINPFSVEYHSAAGPIILLVKDGGRKSPVDDTSVDGAE